jgi:hypothetical protein
MSSYSLLALVARIHPAVWDAIDPRGPRFSSGLDAVALNPQPLPPRERFLVGAAEMAHDVGRLAVEANLKGETTDFVYELVDDWCGTPWPRKWPSPWPGPRQEEGPFPDPWIVDEARVVGAVVFASVASRLPEGDLRSAFAQGAERLSEVAARD